MIIKTLFLSNCSDSVKGNEQRDVQKAENDVVKYVTKIKVWILPCVVSGAAKAWVSPASRGGRLVRCCLYAIKVSLALPPVCELECVWQRGLGVFVSTPRFEHTCNFLSPYLQYDSLKYASSYIVSRSPHTQNKVV